MHANRLPASPPIAVWQDGIRGDAVRSAIISDVYRAMQTRLDGYRQGAGAVMIGIIAGVLAIDSGFVRALLDENLLKALENRPGHYLFFIVFGAGTFVEGICAVGYWVIRDIGKYFSEMTSVVYKIDEANQMWHRDVWFKSQQFYPNKFRIVRDTSNPLAPDSANVTRDGAADPVLIGWHDPTIKRYLYFTAWLMILNLIFYGALLFVGQH